MYLRSFIKHLSCNSIHLHSPYLHSISCISSLSQPPNQQQQQQEDPYLLMKEDPIQICSQIWVKSFTTPNTKPFSNLTGFLSKFDLWVLAYQRSVAHFTGSFPSRNAIQSRVLTHLLSLRNAVIKGHFQWNMKTHLFIYSPNEIPIDVTTSKSKIKKIMELNTPPFQDRVVEELLLMILEPVFESRFSSKSHAFRPGRNAHTVIRTIRSNFAGYVWYLKGDLSEILENLDRDLVMDCLERVVKDKNILGLVKSAFRGSRKCWFGSGDGEEVGGGRGKKKKKKGGGSKRKVLNPNEPKMDPYWLRTFYDFGPVEAERVPNYAFCGILSPLLLNVCLTELDEMMEEMIVEFSKPSMLDSMLITSTPSSCRNPSWPEFVPSGGKEKTKKMDYIRYSGHFLIGIRGHREDAVEMRKVLIEFCWNKFGIKLDNQKLEIEHVSRGVQFLDHIICHRVIYPALHYTGTDGKTVSKRGVGTLLSVTASLSQCIRKFRRLELLKGDRDPEPLPCTPMLYSSQAHTNSQMNKFLETMADWYRYADNRKRIVGFCAYVVRSSLAKLYAARYKLKSRAKVYRKASRNLSHPLRGTGRNVASEYSDLVKMGLVDPIEGVQFSHMSLIPNCDYTPFPRDWIPMHEQVLLEYIKLQDPKFFHQLLTTIRNQGLNVPQDELSEAVWDFKTLGAHRFDNNLKVMWWCK